MRSLHFLLAEHLRPRKHKRMCGSPGCKLVDQHSTHAAGSSIMRAAVRSSPPGSTARGGAEATRGLPASLLFRGWPQASHCGEPPAPAASSGPPSAQPRPLSGAGPAAHLRTKEGAHQPGSSPLMSTQKVDMPSSYPVAAATGHPCKMSALTGGSSTVGLCAWWPHLRTAGP